MKTSNASKAKNQKKTSDTELEKASPHIVAALIEYEQNAVIIRSIIKRATGSVSVISFDKGEGLNEKISPFHTFLHIIDGNADIIIDGKSNALTTGEGIIVPAHASSYIKPNGRFKMLATVIKSGYE